MNDKKFKVIMTMKIIALIIIVASFITLRDDLFTVQNGGSWCFYNPQTNFTCLFEIYS